MTHLVDLTYPVRKPPTNDPAHETDFASVVRNSLLRQTTHKATCQTCKQFATFESRRSIRTRDLPPLLAINAAVHSEETHKFWRDQRKQQTFLKPRIEMRGQIEGMDDPETVVYELRAMVAQVVAKDTNSHLVAIVKGALYNFSHYAAVLTVVNSTRSRGVGPGAVVHLQRLRCAEHHGRGGAKHSLGVEGVPSTSSTARRVPDMLVF